MGMRGMKYRTTSDGDISLTEVPLHNVKCSVRPANWLAKFLWKSLRLCLIVDWEEW